MIYNYFIDSAKDALAICNIGEGLGVLSSVILKADNRPLLNNIVRNLTPHATKLDIKPYIFKGIEFSCQVAATAIQASCEILIKAVTTCSHTALNCISCAARSFKDPIVLVGFAALAYAAYNDYNNFNRVIRVR